MGSLASTPLSMPGVGRGRWSVELVRQRGGPPFSLELEACDDQGRLALPAATRDRAVATGSADLAPGHAARTRTARPAHSRTRNKAERRSGEEWARTRRPAGSPEPIK